MNKFHLYVFFSMVLIGVCLAYIFSIRGENRPGKTATFPAVGKKTLETSSPLAVAFTSYNEVGSSGNNTRKREDVPVSVTLKLKPKTGGRSRKDPGYEQIPATVAAEIFQGGSIGGKPLEDIPTRIPSTNGRPDEIFTLEEIRASMPNAYMVRESAYPPENLTSSEPEKR